jgi:hypothetical protein
MNGVIKLGGTNFTMWKADLMFILAIMDIDDFFHEDKHVEPETKGDNDTALAQRKVEYEKVKDEWKM